MAGDIVETLKQLDVHKTILIGHSMGGRVAMETAFATPSVVEKLILVDILPSPLNSQSSETVSMVSMVLPAMINLDLTQIKSRKDADILLKESIPVSISCFDDCTIQHVCFSIDYRRKGLRILAIPTCCGFPKTHSTCRWW